MPKLSNRLQSVSITVLFAVGCANSEPTDKTLQAELSADDFVQVSTGFAHACGLRSTGAVECWGMYPVGDVMIPVAPPPTGAFKQISAGTAHDCGIREDGSVQCWGSDGRYCQYGTCHGSDGRTDPPPDTTFLSIAAGSAHTCGVKDDNTVACWGNNDSGQAPSSIDGLFASVATTDDHTCGLNFYDGGVFCWGNHPRGDWYSYYNRGNRAISIQRFGACVLKDDSTISCSPGVYSPSTIPNFQKVVHGGGRGCALTIDGTAVCWGGEVELPPGEFLDIATRPDFTCGVTKPGIIVCWGSNEYGQAPRSERH